MFGGEETALLWNKETFMWIPSETVSLFFSFNLRFHGIEKDTCSANGAVKMAPDVVLFTDGDQRFDWVNTSLDGSSHSDVDEKRDVSILLDLDDILFEFFRDHSSLRIHFNLDDRLHSHITGHGVLLETVMAGLRYQNLKFGCVFDTLLFGFRELLLSSK